MHLICSLILDNNSNENFVNVCMENDANPNIQDIVHFLCIQHFDSMVELLFIWLPPAETFRHYKLSYLIISSIK